MRELKFRVWCPTSKHFSTIPWLSCDGLQLKWIHTGNEETLTDIRFDEYVIQQYTGLKDKNGKEIYEGDIVTHTSINGKDYKAEIVFSPTLAAFVLDTSGRHLLDDKYGDYYELHKDHSYEIIGNVFENSELLEK